MNGKIRKLQRILSNKKNRNGKNLKNKKVIKRKIQKQYRVIENTVKELHNKTALFLCRKFDKIYIPKFGTQNMIANYSKGYKEAVAAAVNGLSPEEKKKFHRRVRLSGKSKICFK